MYCLQSIKLSIVYSHKGIIAYGSNCDSIRYWNKILLGYYMGKGYCLGGTTQATEDDQTKTISCYVDYEIGKCT